jgi:hypothetical protein
VGDDWRCNSRKQGDYPRSARQALIDLTPGTLGRECRIVASDVSISIRMRIL